MNYGNSDRIWEMDCWGDRLEIMIHDNSDRIWEMDCWGDHLIREFCAELEIDVPL